MARDSYREHIHKCIYLTKEERKLVPDLKPDYAEVTAREAFQYVLSLLAQKGDK